MPSEKKRRRRGLQFSLRALLVLITAFGVWLGIRVDHVRRQRNLAAAMEGVNGQPLYDWWLGGASGPPGPDWLRSWLGDEYFQDLAGVMLDNNPTLTDAELLRLAVPMKDANVRILNLQMLGRRSPITDVGLARIGEVRTLETLTLQGTNITDETMIRLAKLPRLKGLAVDDTQITDAGISELVALTKLELLRLGRTRVGDDGVEHLAPLQNLRILTLDGTQISNSALRSLRGMPNLRVLHLSYTAIDDRGLVQLQELANLEELNLLGTKTTTEGVKRLQKALPHCKIMR